MISKKIKYFFGIFLILFTFGELARAEPLSLQQIIEAEKTGTKGTWRSSFSDGIWQTIPRNHLKDFVSNFSDIYPVALRDKFVEALIIEASPLEPKDTSFNFYSWRLEKLIKLGAYEEAERLFEEADKDHLSTQDIDNGYIASLYQGKIDKVCLNLKKRESLLKEASYVNDIKDLCRAYVATDTQKEGAYAKIKNETLKKWFLNISNEEVEKLSTDSDAFNSLPRHLQAIAVSQVITNIEVDLKSSAYPETSNALLVMIWNGTKDSKHPLLEAELTYRGLISVEQSRQSQGTYLPDAIKSRFKTAQRIQNPAYLVPIFNSIDKDILKGLSDDDLYLLKKAFVLYGSKSQNKVFSDDKDISAIYLLNVATDSKKYKKQSLEKWFDRYCTSPKVVKTRLCTHNILILNGTYDTEISKKIKKDVFYGKKIYMNFLTNYVISLYKYDGVKDEDFVNKPNLFDLSLLKFLHYGDVSLNEIHPIDIEEILENIRNEGEKALALKLAFSALQ